MPQPSQGENIRISKSANIHPDTDFRHPIFCLKYLHKDFHLTACNKEEKISFIDRLVKLSSMSWEEIKLAPRHGLGTEKIKVDSLNAKIPGSFFTDDVSEVLAFRFHNKAPFVGYRNKYIFHIVFIDRVFTLYNPG